MFETTVDYFFRMLYGRHSFQFPHHQYQQNGHCAFQGFIKILKIISILIIIRINVRGQYFDFLCGGKWDHQVHQESGIGTF